MPKRTAIAHAEAICSDLHARIKEQKAYKEESMEEVLEDLDKAMRHAKAAMDPKGAQFGEHLRKGIAARAAIEDEATSWSSRAIIRSGGRLVSA